MSLKSNNYPPPQYTPPGQEGAEGGGGFYGQRGWNLDKEYAEIYDGWVGAFRIGSGGELLSPGLDLCPGYIGIIDFTSGLIRSWTDITLNFGEGGYWGDLYLQRNGVNVIETGQNYLLQTGLAPSINGGAILGFSNRRWDFGFFNNLWSINGCYTGDLIFKNNWVITENDEEDGLLIVNSKGDIVCEINDDGISTPKKVKKLKDFDKKMKKLEKMKENTKITEKEKLNKEEKDKLHAEHQEQRRQKILDGFRSRPTYREERKI